MNGPATLTYWKRCSLTRSYGGVLLSGAVKTEGNETSSLTQGCRELGVETAIPLLENTCDFERQLQNIDTCFPWVSLGYLSNL
jgi:hypothetical protein